MVKKIYSIFMGTLLATILLGTYVPSPGAKEKVHLRIIDSSSKSASMAHCVALNLLSERHSDWITGETFPTKGYGEATYFLLTGKGEICTTGEITLERVRQGLGEFKALGKRNDIRILFNLHGGFMSVIVREDSDITAFTKEQLKGKTIATRQAGTLTAGYALHYLDALGIDKEKDVRMLYLSARDSNYALSDGTADLLLMNYGHPNAGLMELFETKPCRFLDIPKEVTNKVGHGIVYRKMPAGLYRNQDKPIESGVQFPYLVCKADFDPDVAYELIKLWWTHVDERNEVHPAIKRYGTVEYLKAALGGTPTPLHEGALRYYRERGWLK